VKCFAGVPSSDPNSPEGSFQRMTEEDQKLMEMYEITFEKKTVYYFFYKGYKYEKLSDALNYAKIDKSRNKCPGELR
jgi:hypothetical protein